MNPNSPYPPGAGTPGQPQQQPNAQQAYPQQAYPQQAYPQQAYPQQAQQPYAQPQQAYPQQPQQPYAQPQQAYPQQPQQSYPQQTPGYAPPQAPAQPASGAVPAPAAGAPEYTIAVSPAGWGKAISLYFKTFGCTIHRLLITTLVYGVGMALLVVGMVAAVIGNSLGGSTVAGIACIPFVLVAAGWLWFTSGWIFRTYAGHTAVLAELIRTGQIDTQGKGLAAHGTAIATEVFGDAEGVASCQRNFDHVLGSAQDAIASAVSFLPASIAGWLRGLMTNARTYLAWLMVSYVFATRRAGRSRQEVDTVVLHAFAQVVQSWKKLLPTILFSVMAEGVLLLPVWVFGGLGAIGGWAAAAWGITSAGLAAAAPSGLPAEMAGIIPVIVAVIVGILFGSVTTVIIVGTHRHLLIRPLCLIRAMLYFHEEVASRPFDRKLVASISRLEDLAEKIDRHGGSLGDVAGTAGNAFGVMKGFMGGD